MTPRVDVEPTVLYWALDRARREPADLEKAFPRLSAWLSKDAKPTLKQLQRFAKATHTPFGCLVLPEPPDEGIPIPDFRTLRDGSLLQPSADLLDTIYICERRQAWFREHIRFEDFDRRLEWIGSARPTDAPGSVARRMAKALDFTMSMRRSLPTWEAALRTLIESAERIGVLVMVNGIVGSNTHRALDPAEFRGFALSDPVAPLVFVNGADTKSAQMFTLAHEIAHLWLGATGLSDVPVETPVRGEERWCNRVAAELLVPAEVVARAHQARAALEEEIQRLARLFKVSTLVVLRRLHDLDRISTTRFRSAYRKEEARVLALVRKKRSSGGSFYRTHFKRVSRTFAESVVASALEGKTLYRDAMQLLSISTVSTLHEMASRMELGP